MTTQQQQQQIHEQVKPSYWLVSCGMAGVRALLLDTLRTGAEQGAGPEVAGEVGELLGEWQDN